jgi:hypothetical protein
MQNSLKAKNNDFGCSVGSFFFIVSLLFLMMVEFEAVSKISFFGAGQGS